MSSLKTLMNIAALDISLVEKNIDQCLEILEKEVSEIDDDDVAHLTTILNNNKSEKVFQLIAELAKKEQKNRVQLAKEDLMKMLVVSLIDSELKDTYQILRSLCNICADNDVGSQMFSKVGGVSVMYEKASKVLHSDDWDSIMFPACMCIQNIVSDSDLIKEEFLKAGYFTLLRQLLHRYEANEKNFKVTVSGISLLADSDLGIELLGCSGILEDIWKIMKNCEDNFKKIIMVELLNDLGKKENAIELLCKFGGVLTLMELVEAHGAFQETDSADVVFKEMVDLIVIMSGDESFITLLENEDLLNKFANWIKSCNKHVQISAGLMLGNYARSEDTCDRLIKMGIHVSLITEINQNLEKDDYEDRFQAFASCLRNLCIPVGCKQLLVKAGLADTAVELIKKTGLSVQFKALAILRLLVQNQNDLAVKLCNDGELLKKIKLLSDVTMVSSTPAEAQRLMAAIIKYANQEAPIRAALSYECIGSVNYLLSSDHMLMQNEGLIALIMIVANVNDCVELIKKAGSIERLMKIIKQDDVQPQTLFNSLTLIQATASLNGGKDLLEEFEVYKVLDLLKNHSEQIINNKVNETLTVISR